MDRHVWRDTTVPTATDYVNGLRDRIQTELRLPVSAGLGRSTWMAKLATSAAKPGFVEVPPDREQEFLADRPVNELAGVGKRRERSLAALGALTFGDVARLPSTVMQQRFGIWGATVVVVCQWSLERALASGSEGSHYDFQQHHAAV